MRPSHFLAKFRPAYQHEAPNQGTNGTKQTHAQNDQKIAKREGPTPNAAQQLGQTKPPHIRTTDALREPTTKSNETAAIAEQPRP